MTCKNCGSEVKASDKFCGMCGTQNELFEISGENDGRDNETKFEKIMSKHIYKNLSAGDIENCSTVMSILMVLLQLVRMICVCFDFSTSFLFVGELFVVLSDWYFLSKMGIRGIWKLWGLFFYPVYLFIKARKTNKKYVWSILCTAILVGGVIMLSIVFNGVNSGSAPNLITENTGNATSIEGKIKSQITSLVSKYNSFLEKAIINDDSISYQTVMGAFLLQESYFLQYDGDPYVYYAKYAENQNDLYTIMLFFDENGELSKISIGASFVTNPNRAEGAYECLSILAYGMISATNPEMTVDEVKECYKEVAVNAGEYYIHNDIKYAAYGTEEMLVFEIIMEP